MKKIIALSAIVLTLLFLSGCRSAAVYNVQNAPSGVTKASDKQIYDAIKQAGISLGWIVKKIKPGLATAQLNLRSHMALVEISYTKKDYSINYKNSMNLKYNAEKGTIHSNYNGWVQNLNQAIQVQLSQHN